MSSIIRTPVGIVKAWQEGGISLYCSVIYLIAYTYNPTNSIHRFFFSSIAPNRRTGDIPSGAEKHALFLIKAKIISLSLYYVYVFAFHATFYAFSCFFYLLLVVL